MPSPSALATTIDRRRFLKSAMAGSLGFALPSILRAEGHEESFDALTRDLLRDWCDGMLAVRIDAPGDPTRHGALNCPGCDFITAAAWTPSILSSTWPRSPARKQCTFYSDLAVCEVARPGCWCVQPG